MGGLPADSYRRGRRRRRSYIRYVVSYDRHKENSVQLRRSPDTLQYRDGGLPSH